MENDFKHILYEFLEENNLTQSEFAKKVNIRQGQVSEWLHGRSKPGYDLLRSISLAFNVSADYFLGITDKY